MTKVIELECGHNLYFDIEPDTVDETLWCSKCNDYVELAPTVAKLRGVWVIDSNGEFKSQRQSKRKFAGECLYSQCTYSHTSYKGWFHLRDELHKHYMREHTNYGSIEIEYVDRLPPNSDAPF